MPVRRSIISAITQKPEVGWYVNLLPTGHSRRHLEKRSRRLLLSGHSSCGNGAFGNPPTWSSTCSTVILSLPLVPNSGMISATTSLVLSLPSPIRIHDAADMIAFVHEKIVYSVSL